MNLKSKNGPLTKSTLVRVSGKLDPAGRTSVSIVHTAVRTNRLTNPFPMASFLSRPPWIPVKLLTNFKNFTDSTVNSINIVDYDGILFSARN